MFVFMFCTAPSAEEIFLPGGLVPPHGSDRRQFLLDTFETRLSDVFSTFQKFL